jgi:hypothetical protein
MFAASDRSAQALQTENSNLATLVGKRTFPANNLYSWVLTRPFRDFRRRQNHALKKRTAAFEKQMFVAAIAGIGQQTYRQDEIDHVHRKPLSCIMRTVISSAGRRRQRVPDYAQLKKPSIRQTKHAQSLMQLYFAKDADSGC